MSSSSSASVGEIEIITADKDKDSQWDKWVHWVIPKFSEYEKNFRSQVFESVTCFGKMKWCLEVNPNIQKEIGDDQKVGIFLRLLKKYPFSAKADGMPYNATCEFTIMTPKPISKKFENLDFSKDGSNWGFLEFVSRKTILSLCAAINNLIIEAKLVVFQGLSNCDLHSEYASMLKEQEFGDFHLVCEGERILVYKGILAMGSAVFRANFSSENKDVLEGTLEITDISLATLRRMLHYLYTRLVPHGKNNQELLIAADKYEIRGLIDWCIVKLTSEINTDNVCEYLILADSLSHIANSLKKRCIQVILQNSSHIENRKGWEELKQHVDLFAEVSCALETNKKLNENAIKN
jgi:hypothetical protein